MNKKIILLGHGVGVKFSIDSLNQRSDLGYQVVGVVTHPKEEHQYDLEMMEKRGDRFGEYAYNVFDVENNYGIPILESKNVNSSETVDWIMRFDPAYIVSIGCRNIIKKPFLQKFPKKVLNIHTAPLPRYRGAASDSWMILNGEWGSRQFGCVHFIDTGIDTGNIVAKSFFDIPLFIYPIDLFKIRMDTFRNLLPKALENLKEPEFQGEQQNFEEATSFPRLFTPVDGKINWHDCGEDLVKFIYAFGYPHEGASCFFGNEKVNILCAEFFQKIQLHPFAIGLIFGKDSKGNYKVAVRDGYLLIKKIEVDGKEVQQKKIFRLGRRLT